MALNRNEWILLGLAGLGAYLLYENVPAVLTPPPGAPPLPAPESAEQHYQVKFRLPDGSIGYTNIDLPNNQFPTLAAFIASYGQNGLTAQAVKVFRFPWDQTPTTALERATAAAYPSY